MSGLRRRRARAAHIATSVDVTLDPIRKVLRWASSPSAYQGIGAHPTALPRPLDRNSLADACKGGRRVV